MWTFNEMCREIMHAMWKPVRYKYVYVACTLFVLTISVPHSVAMYWAYGDKLNHQSNALALLPVSYARATALGFMIIHQVCLLIHKNLI
jgi:auxin influx carrier (AUX1 LAX family)